MAYEVDYSRVEKQVMKLPIFIYDLFFKWVKDIESIGWVEVKQIKKYKDHTLKGKWKGMRVACLGRSYRIIYKIDKSYDIYIIKVERISKHDYKK